MRRKINNIIKKTAMLFMTAIVVAGGISDSTFSVMADEVATTADNTYVKWSKNADGKFLNGNGQVIEGATMKGIDVSKWNGNIDWAKVAASDVDYAIIRCGFGDDITKQDDTYWKKNEGVKITNTFGVYLFLCNTVEQAKSEVSCFETC
ncbi:MAG: hypothetical protein ACLT2Z_07270 [Eubacterium sp.]